jgi:hypothetical protein
MLGTKMRALFQGRRGPDLFDLYWALTLANPPLNPPAIIESFASTRDPDACLLSRYLQTRPLCSPKRT